MSLQNQISIILKGMDLLEKYALSGDVQSHEAFAIVKSSGLEEKLSEVTNRIKDSAIENLNNNFLEGKKTYRDSKFSYTVRSGSTRYYFTNIPEVQKAKKENEVSETFIRFKEVEQKYKTAFLIKQKGHVMVDEETGEVIDPSLVSVVYSSDSLSVKPC